MGYRMENDAVLVLRFYTSCKYVTWFVDLVKRYRKYRSIESFEHYYTNS